MSAPRPVRRVLVANRGEIAARVVRTCREMGIRTVAVFSDADREAPFVDEADEAVALGGSTPAESYLRADALLQAARATGADAVHPGYGFLSENAAFARAVRDAGLTWIGPRPESIEALGSKLAAKRLLKRSGVPLVPWLEPAADLGAAAIAERLGLPLLVKAAAGGGGRGMRVVHSADELAEAVAACRREAESAFADGTVFVEPYLEGARHVEVQVFGDTRGQIVSIFERDCSVQRRHQKLIEEAPSPAVSWTVRQRLGAAAVAVAQAADYVGAGTVEFLLHPDGQFFFLEMNTRLQVEHPVTEAITGLDLVRLQILVAQGEPLPREATHAAMQGHAVEARLYAEDPAAGDRPCTGRLTRLRWPATKGVRVDAAVAEGSVVTPFYDALLAKLIAHAPTRAEAVARLAGFLEQAQVHGVATNRDLLVRVLRDDAFAAGEVDTRFLERRPELRAARVSPADERLHAVAATLAGVAARRAAAPVAGFAPAGFRNNPSAAEVVAWQGAHGRHDVAWRRTREGWQVAVSGEPLPGLRVDRAEPARVDLEVAGVRRRYDVHADGGAADVDGPAGHGRLVELPRFADAVAATASGSLAAPLPGRVLRVGAAVGRRVVAGETVLVLEAMKMEHRVTAPCDGTVAELRVREGDQVEAGAVLAVVQA